jgi:hypothetical protein
MYALRRKPYRRNEDRRISTINVPVGMYAHRRKKHNRK